MNKKLISTIAVIMVSTLSLFAVSFKPFMETEQGTIGLLHHTYQNGDGGDEFDFIKQGGQNNLYPFSRYSVGATINENHRIWFTYQPLQIDTAVNFASAVTIGGKTFDGPMEMTYSFPFYRGTYTYDILQNHEQAYLGVGLALQIRNASIQFREVYDGSATDVADYYISQNVGIVPALAIYSEYRFPFGLTLSADIAGSYANLAFINGADYKFEGSILDASLRMAYEIENGFSLFGNARFFGGTADGISENDPGVWTESTEEYTKNYIASMTFSAGLSYQMQ